MSENFSIQSSGIYPQEPEKTGSKKTSKVAGQKRKESTPSDEKVEQAAKRLKTEQPETLATDKPKIDTSAPHMSQTVYDIAEQTGLIPVPEAPTAPDAPMAPDGPDAPMAPEAPTAPDAPDAPIVMEDVEKEKVRLTLQPQATPRPFEYVLPEQEATKQPPKEDFQKTSRHPLNHFRAMKTVSLKKSVNKVLEDADFCDTVKKGWAQITTAIKEEMGKKSGDHALFAKLFDYKMQCAAAIQDVNFLLNKLEKASSQVKNTKAWKEATALLSGIKKQGDEFLKYHFSDPKELKETLDYLQGHIERHEKLLDFQFPVNISVQRHLEELLTHVETLNNCLKIDSKNDLITKMLSDYYEKDKEKYQTVIAKIQGIAWSAPLKDEAQFEELFNTMFKVFVDKKDFFGFTEVKKALHSSENEKLLKNLSTENVNKLKKEFSKLSLEMRLQCINHFSQTKTLDALGKSWLKNLEEKVGDLQLAISSKDLQKIFHVSVTNGLQFLAQNTSKLQHVSGELDFEKLGAILKAPLKQLKGKLSSQDEKALDKLFNSLVDSLSNQYDQLLEMREKEIERDPSQQKEVQKLTEKAITALEKKYMQIAATRKTEAEYAEKAAFVISGLKKLAEGQAQVSTVDMTAPFETVEKQELTTKRKTHIETVLQAQGYKVGKKLGHGATADVYAAEKGGKQFAIKMFFESISSDIWNIEKAEGERIGAQLKDVSKHIFFMLPDVVYDKDGSIMATSMPILSGRHDLIKDIDKGIATKQAKKPRDAQPLLKGIALGLSELHKRNIAHLDLGPQNISVDEKGGAPIIIDFGYARRIPKESGGLEGTSTGTKEYNAPEAASDLYGKVTTKADAYSFGQIMLALLEAKTLQRGYDPNTIQFEHIKDEGLQKLIRGLLQPQVKDRISIEECLKHPYFS